MSVPAVRDVPPSAIVWYRRVFHLRWYTTARGQSRGLPFDTTVGSPPHEPGETCMLLIGAEHGPAIWGGVFGKSAAGTQGSVVCGCSSRRTYVYC